MGGGGGGTGFLEEGEGENAMPPCKCNPFFWFVCLFARRTAEVTNKPNVEDVNLFHVH